jgi:hypothetical protein
MVKVGVLGSTDGIRLRVGYRRGSKKANELSSVRSEHCSLRMKRPVEGKRVYEREEVVTKRAAYGECRRI